MILFIGLPATIIFIATIWWMLAFSKKQAIALHHTEITRHARTAALQFDQYIGEAARLADSTARFISRAPNLGEGQIIGLLKGTLKDNPRVYGAAAAFEPGTHEETEGLYCPYVFRSGLHTVEEINIDETVYDWYRDEQWTWWHLPKEKGTGVWTEPYFDEGAGNVLMITYSAPFNLHGEFGGVTTVDIDLEELQEDIKEIIPDLGEFYILAPDGKYIFSPNAEEILNGSIFASLEKSGLSGISPKFQEMMSGGRGSITVSGLFNRTDTVVAFAPITSTGWTYISLIAKSEVMAEFTYKKTIVIAAFAVAVFFMLATIIYMSGRLANPISRLRNQVQHIAEGHMDVTIDEILTGDEIEELAISFTDMQARILDRENQLKNSRESTLADLLESAPDAMLVADQNGDICRMNGMMLEIFGYTRDEINQANVELLMPDRFRDGHGAHLKAYFANPHAREMGAELELLGKRKDGTEFPIEIALSPFHEPEGLRAVAAIRDITDRKLREEELRKLNQAVEQGSAIVFITDGEGIIEYVNPRFTEVTGYQPEEAIGQSPRILKSGMQSADIYTDVWTSLTNGEEWRGEFCNRRKDGTLFWASAALSPIRAPNGEITHFVGIEDDVTAEKAAAEEIKQKEERFRTLLSNLPGTVYRCANDDDGTMQFISDRVEELTGYPGEEFLFNKVRTYDSVIHPDDRQTVAKEVAEAVDKQEAWTIQYRIVHRSGSVHWAGERGRAAYRDDGEVEYLDGVIIDITKEKKLESELTLARVQAEAANHAKSDFLSSMSHELRTPLNGVLGYAQILQRDKQLGSRQRENVDSIINCGDHLLSLINDVLDLSKIEAGRVDLDLGPCDLDKLIRSLADIVGERARVKGLEFRIEVSPEVPRGIMTDEAKLRQVLVNLLGNAVKFTETGSVILRASEAEKGKLHIEVIDSGVGMNATELKEIFDPFKQVEAGKAAGGTGLGLAISQKLLEKMAGGIEVESKKGKGSTFRVIIPLEEINKADFEPSDFKSLNTAEEFALAPGESLNILVADDRQANRDILEQMLDDAGIDVVLADDGDTAIEALKTNDIDLVLLDVRMPRLNGIDAVRQIRSDEELKDTTVIAVTASVFPEFQDKAIEAGFNDFLPKPFRTSELMKKIRDFTKVTWKATATSAAPGLQLPDELDDEPMAEMKLSPDHFEQFKSALKIKNLTALKSLARELEDSDDPAASAAGTEIARLVNAFNFEGLSELEASLGK